MGIIKMNDIEKITIESSDYPKLLRFIKNPPNTLYYRGDFSLCDTLCLAVVGARRCTPYGKWAAYHIARRAAEHGVTIVSGMASGIDSAGHRGALDAGGKTIAVLGCGVDICYPKNNKGLMDQIGKQGLIISEYTAGSPPLPFQFPMRNRIISGLSQGVLIAEASLGSGSLITAECALEQGREVYGVPGNINNIYSIGVNKLIQDGATPIVVIDDILTALGIKKKVEGTSKQDALGKDEKGILNIISNSGEVNLDFLCKKSGKSPAEVGALVTILEMKGRVQTSLGKIYIAKY
ncbi:MAG: DNA-processing protein DprA [Eubacteriales bacterium]|nr:DNA-processing protein DprA [Eubacteriales bacterium]